MLNLVWYILYIFVHNLQALNYATGGEHFVAMLVKTGLNNVLLPTLPTVVNNIIQYCYIGFRLNNIIQYC